MKTIRVKYTDWWEGFDPSRYIYNKVLSKHYEVVESDDPEYVFCSLYSCDCLEYDAIRIFTTGDNYVPDFNMYDYVIAFNPIVFGDRYLQAPNWIMNPSYERDVELMLHKHENVSEEDYEKRDFCAWVCSNSKGDWRREETFRRLNQYKKVDSGGRWLNNIGEPEGVSDKIEFQRNHRFSITIQDSENDGYLDEKLVQGFASKTIPIFWGDRTADKLFNSSAMVDFHLFDDLDEVIKEVERLDGDKDEYLRRLSTPALRNPLYVEQKYKELEEFLVNIVEQPLSQAQRRTRSVWSEYYDNMNRSYRNTSNKKSRGKGLLRWF